MVADDPSLSIGDPNKVANGTVDQEVIQGAKLTIKKLLEDAIDRGCYSIDISFINDICFNFDDLGMKTTPEPAIVLLVGGGSVIAPTELEGVGGEHSGHVIKHHLDLRPY